MENVEIKTEGSKLIIIIDTAKEVGLSESKKTTIIGTTRGNQPVSVNGKVVTLGLNVYRK